MIVNISRNNSSARAKQSGNVFALVLIAIVAASIGYFAFKASLNSSDPGLAGSQSSNAGDAALSALQGNLQTSLALPINFKSVPEFSLLDVNGNELDETVLDDKWSLMFFGFTHCPDICPITLQIMKDVVAQLEPQQLQIVFVSVDPVRDTPEILKKYIGYFDEEFVGITGELSQVHALTSSLGVVASFTANDTDPENYSVDHTASLLLVDPRRNLRAKVTPPLEAEKIVSDITLVIGAPS
jgi:protein SCO1/2